MLSFIQKLYDTRYRLMIFALLGVSGCANVDVSATRALPAVENALQHELHIQYSELALHEKAEGNPQSAKLFNDKARQAASGVVVNPEKPKNTAMHESYDQLMRIMGSRENIIGPADVARAQVMYDCWLEEQSENIDKGDIAACKEGFEAVRHIYESKLSEVRQ